MTLATQEKGFPCGSAGKESACNAGDLGSILGLRRSPGEGKGYPLQYSGLENSMGCIVHGVAKSQTWLGDFHFTHTQEMDQTAPRHIRLKFLCSPKCSLSLWFSDKNHFSVFTAHLYEKSFLFCWIQSSVNDINFLDFKKQRRWKRACIYFSNAPHGFPNSVLQSMGSQRVGHHWAAELNWNRLCSVQEVGSWCLSTNRPPEGRCARFWLERSLQVWFLPSRWFAKQPGGAAQATRTVFWFAAHFQ